MQFGILGQIAPELRVNHWIDGNCKKADIFRLSDHDEKVRVLYLFQAWCPGCHSYGFPTLKSLTQRFSNQDVEFAVIQTVFEGHSSNGVERLREMQEKYQLDLPFGQDETRPRPTTLSDYRTGGTPWFIVIDKTGRVIANDYRPDNLEKIIEQALTDRHHKATPDTITTRHEPQQNRYVVDFGNGHEGELVYRREGKTLHLLHSEVPRSLRGQGFGGALMEHALDHIEKDGFKVTPVCSYTRAYLSRYKRWAHLLAA